MNVTKLANKGRVSDTSAYPGYPLRPYDPYTAGYGHYGGEDNFLNLRQILLPLWRWKWMIGSVIALFVLAASIVVSYLTPRYSAETVVVLENEKKEAFDFANITRGLPSDEATIQSQIEIIQSKDVALAVVERLQLGQHPEFDPKLLPKPETLPDPVGWPSLSRLQENWEIGAYGLRLWDAAVSHLDNLVYTIKYYVLVRNAKREAQKRSSPLSQGPLSETGQLDGGRLDEAAPLAKNMEEVLRNYFDRLDVDQRSRSRAIAISFSASHPELAALIANSIAEAYLEAQITQKYNRLQTGNRWLDTRVAKLRTNVEDAEQAIEDYRTLAGLLEGGRGTLVSQQITEINAQLVLVKSERAALESQLSTIRGLISNADEEELQSAADVMNSPLIRELQEQEAELRRERADLSATYGSRHPQMVRIENELASLRGKISDEMRKIVRRLENDVSAIRAKEASIRASLEALKDELAEVNQAEVKLRALQREADASRQILTNFLEVHKHTQTQEDRDILKADASIISVASAKQRPDYPNKKLVVGIAGLAGILFAGFLVALLEQLDKGFRSGQQIEELTGLPYLGMIPRLGLGLVAGKDLARYVLEKPTSALSEAFRALYTSIVLASDGPNTKVIVVTSTNPDEGKSTTSTTLSRVTALLGKKVLLIDGDVRVSSISEFLELPTSPGLTEYLNGSIDFQSAVQTDKHSGLSVITSGAFAMNITALLTEQKMQDLLQEARAAFDYIIIDSPPVMAVSEARLLAKLSDGVILTVKWGETPREAVLQSINQLRAADCRLLGTLVTMVNLKKYAHYGFGDSSAYQSQNAKYYGNVA